MFCVWFLVFRVVFFVLGFRSLGLGFRVEVQGFVFRVWVACVGFRVSGWGQRARGRSRRGGGSPS